MKPAHHRIKIAKDPAGGHGGACDHHDLKPQLPRGVDLGLRPDPARILGEQDFGAVIAHQRQIIGQTERPARPFDPRLRQREIGVRRIDHPHQKIMLRQMGEIGQMQPPDGQKHPRRRTIERAHRGRHIFDLQPAIGRFGLPSGPLESAKRHALARGRLHGIGADARREGMGGIDDLPDPFRRQIIGQPLGPAEAADPHRHRLRPRLADATGIGQHRRQTLPRQFRDKRAGFGGAAKNEGGFHV